MLKPGYERVHTVTSYYDYPRRGIADFDGRPHLYEDEDLVANDFTYQLSPVDPRLFELALESWGIWRRWEKAFHEGRTTIDTHPALPDERTRSDELDQLLDLELRIDDGNHVRALADFVPLDDPEWDGLGSQPRQVKWTRR